MIGSVERYSSSTRKKRMSFMSSRVLRILLLALILFIIITRFFVSTYRIESVSMSPVLKPGDRVFTSVVAFGARVPFSRSLLPGFSTPARGDIVVVQPPYFGDDSVLKRFFEPLVGFFTLQKGSLYQDPEGGRAQGYVVKRIVGVPGDTIRMRGFVAYIKPRGASEFSIETSLIHFPSPPQTALHAAGWQPEFPYAGNTEEVVLHDGEYFVLGDNRPDSSDSRSWGVLTRPRIVAKVILRYWPPRSIGKL